MRHGTKSSNEQVSPGYPDGGKSGLTHRLPEWFSLGAWTVSMARIRTIKPEFFTSEDIVSLSPLARLFYVSLWCEADREGRLEWKPKTFKLRYLPGDDCSVDALGQELIDSGLVLLYEVDGKVYAEIPSFTKHQIINNRESESQIPSRVPHASTTRQPRVLAEGKGRKGKEGDSTEPQGDSLPPSAPASPAVVSIPLVDKTEFAVTQAMVDEWEQTFPAVDVVAALRRMRAWCTANPTQKKTARGVQSFVVRWLGKEQDSGPRGRAAAPGDSGIGAFV